jgi:Na+-driven multidrug efflux pump
MVIGLGIILAWFVPWYLQRSGQIIWPIHNVFVTLGLGLASAVIVLLWMYLRGRNRGENERFQMDSPADKD